MKVHVFDTVLGICFVTQCEREDAAAAVLRDSGVDLSAYEPVSFDNEFEWAVYMEKTYPDMLDDLEDGSRHLLAQVQADAYKLGES